MSEHRTGEWPVKHPVAVVPATPEPTAARTEPAPLPDVDVRLTATVDLTGHYTSSHAVADDFCAQTRRSQYCHTAIVRLGPDATVHSTGLGQLIASAFYLSVERIDIETPAGYWQGPALYSEVVGYVRRFRADHQRQQWQIAQASG